MPMAVKDKVRTEHELRAAMRDRAVKVHAVVDAATALERAEHAVTESDKAIDVLLDELNKGRADA